jgi:hypothetical protein
MRICNDSSILIANLVACPPDPAFGGVASFDFTTASSVTDLDSFWDVDGGVKYATKPQMTFDKSTGAVFIINEEPNAPTIISKKYLFFGKVDVEVQAAPGQGIVTAITLMSDDKDEIDFVSTSNHHMSHSISD